jgi:hypothetical protein
MSSENVHFILKFLTSENYLEGRMNGQGLGGFFTLTMKGWKRYEDLQRGAVSGKTAFMAMQFGNKELDEMVNNYFRPAVEKTGFTLLRLDDDHKAGLIDDKMRVNIKKSRFLIADLSHTNNGAYWEAGYAEGLGKLVIYTCEEKIFNNPNTRPHFDTNHHLTITWSSNKIKETMDALVNTIRATIPDATY